MRPKTQNNLSLSNNTQNAIKVNLNGRKLHQSNLHPHPHTFLENPILKDEEKINNLSSLSNG